MQARRLILAAATAALLFGPSLAAQALWSEAGRSSVDGAPVTFRLHYPMRIDFDAHGVTRADSGSYLEYTMLMRDGTVRLGRVAGTGGGRLERTIRVAGQSVPFDSAAARVTAAAQELAVLHLEIPGDSYVRTAWRRNGLDSALALVSAQPIFTTRGYFALLGDSALAPADLWRVMERVAREPQNGSALRWLLEPALASPAAGSDSMRARILALVGRLPSHERGEVLGGPQVLAAAERPLARAAYLEQLRRLDFDDERVIALFALVDRRATSDGLLASALRSLPMLPPADRARVLTAVPAARLARPEVRAAYRDALAAMPAGAERNAAAAHLQAIGASARGGAR